MKRRQAVILPAVILARWRGLEFVMVWSDMEAPGVHVEQGPRYGHVDIRTCRVDRSCMTKAGEQLAEEWVSKNRTALAQAWDRIGHPRRKTVRFNPQVSRFHDETRIEIYWADHARPHIHVRRGGQVTVIEIRSREIVKGQRLSKGFKKVLMPWLEAHEVDLLNRWDLASNLDPDLPQIPPP